MGQKKETSLQLNPGNVLENAQPINSNMLISTPPIYDKRHY